MGIKEYLQTLNKKMRSYDKSAKNPFLEYNYAYNPFKSAISQTYVWVERENGKNTALNDFEACSPENKNKAESAFDTSESTENPLKNEKGGD